MKNAYTNWTKNGRPAIATLIVCLGMLFSGKSTASTTTAPVDSSRRVVVLVRAIPTKPIRLTEEAARQVLKDKADLLILQGVISSQDTLLKQQREAYSSQGLTIQQLNERQQQAANQVGQLRGQLDTTSRKLRAARWENWLVRLGAVAYVAVRLKLI